MVIESEIDDVEVVVSVVVVVVVVSVIDSIIVSPAISVYQYEVYGLTGPYEDVDASVGIERQRT